MTPNKDKLLKILDAPANKVFAIDLDGVLAEGEFWGEGEPKPIQKMIDQVWVWYKAGAHVIIYTARPPSWFAHTQAWLLKHDVPFHGIVMKVKPGADIYIDDKALNLDDIPK